jgi:hypothetical protein
LSVVILPDCGLLLPIWIQGVGVPTAVVLDGVETPRNVGETMQKVLA